MRTVNARIRRYVADHRWALRTARRDLYEASVIGTQTVCATTVVIIGAVVAFREAAFNPKVWATALIGTWCAGAVGTVLARRSMRRGPEQLDLRDAAMGHDDQPKRSDVILPGGWHESLHRAPMRDRCDGSSISDRELREWLNGSKP